MAGTEGSSRVEAGLLPPRNESCNEGDVTVPHWPSLNTPDFRLAPQTSDAEPRHGHAADTPDVPQPRTDLLRRCISDTYSVSKA